jgi:HAD superfamily hydrolase (TIGR01509 family)
MRGLIFDLDGTLVDTVYAHTAAWHRALLDEDFAIDAWELHRLIGKAGDQLLKTVARDHSLEIGPAQIARLKNSHRTYCRQFLPSRPPLTGAIELLRYLRDRNIPHGIATSGDQLDCEPALTILGVPKDTVVVRHEDVPQSKPNPDMFIVCRQKLDLAANECFVVGDAIWDLLAARRAGMLSIGLLTGGTGAEELLDAGAYRVFKNPRELLKSLDDLGLD